MIEIANSSYQHLSLEKHSSLHNCYLFYYEANVTISPSPSLSFVISLQQFQSPLHFLTSPFLAYLFLFLNVSTRSLNHDLFSMKPSDNYNNYSPFP